MENGIQLRERWPDIVDVVIGNLPVGTVLYASHRRGWYFWLGSPGDGGYCSEYFTERDEAVATLIDRREAWLQGIADAAVEGLRAYRAARQAIGETVSRFIEESDQDRTTRELLGDDLYREARRRRDFDPDQQMP